MVTRVEPSRVIDSSHAVTGWSCDGESFIETIHSASSLERYIIFFGTEPSKIWIVILIFNGVLGCCVRVREDVSEFLVLQNLCVPFVLIKLIESFSCLLQRLSDRCDG